jgi:hypothetical protein
MGEWENAEKKQKFRKRSERMVRDGEEKMSEKGERSQS